MPLVSRKGILAIAAVIDVALNARERPVSARALAARHKLPPRHLEPVLQALVRDGILKGIRGPHGGYALARERKRISAEDIVRAASHAEEDGDPPLPASRAAQRRGAAGAGRSRARILRRARPHQHRRHRPPRRGAEVNLIRHSETMPFTVWTLSARSPHGGKVQRFGGRRGGRLGRIPGASL